MAISEKELFTYTWQIENFSMCPHRCGENIKTPTFVVDFLEETEWRLCVYPRAHKDTNFISCYLERTSGGDYAQEMRIGFLIRGISVHPGKDVKRLVADHAFKKDGDWGYNSFCSREDIFNTTNGLLLNDTLTIKCHMWKYAPDLENIETIVPDLINTNCWNSKINQCFSRTRIKVGSTVVLWPIKRFSKMNSNTKLSKNVVSAMEDEPSFEMTFYLKEGSKDNNNIAYIEVRRKDVNDENKSIFVRGKIKTIGAPKKIMLQAIDKCHFDGKKRDQIWQFPTFINREDLLKSKYLSYTNDILYIHFEFSFSTSEEELTIETKHFTPHIYYTEEKKFNLLRENYQLLYKDGRFSDIILRVKGQDFKVHKNILGTASDVFSAMFETDMQEKERGIVEIQDADPDIMDRMLTFIYTEALDDLEHEEAVKLYSLADKYQVISLKWKCCCALLSSLSVFTVCNILILADMHHDEDLKESVQDYIEMNALEIFNSQNWKDFTQTNAQIAADIMLYILTKDNLTFSHDLHKKKIEIAFEIEKKIGGLRRVIEGGVK